MMLEVAAVVLLVAVVVYGAVLLAVRPRAQARPMTGEGVWQAAHYDVKGATKVVLQRVAVSGASVLDEHVIAVIPAGDPEYDAKFLAAMATARERRALFEAEDE